MKKIILVSIGVAMIIGCQGNQPPTINSINISPDTVFVGDTSLLIISASDPEDESINYTWVSIDEGGRNYEGDSVRWFPISEGIYRFFARVEDRWGLADTSETLSVNAINGKITIYDIEGSGKTVNIVWSRYTGVAFSEYQIYMSTTANFSKSEGTLVYSTSNLLDTTCTVTDLSSGVYYFRAFVVISSGSSLGSEEHTFNMNAVTPSTLRDPYNIKSNSVDLSWSPSPDLDFYYYEIHVSKTSNFTPSTATLSGTNNTRNDTLDTVTGLEPGETYYFKVVTVDTSNNRGFSNEVSAKTLNYTEAGKCDLMNGHSMDMVMIGSYMYVAAKEAGLVSINVSNSQNPSADGGFSSGYNECNDVYGDNNYLYVAMEDSVFVLQHTTNPANPTTVGKVTVRSATRPDAIALSIFKLGTYLYTGLQNNNIYYLIVIDISNPATPTPVVGGELQIPSKPNDIYVDGSYAYIADGTAGIVIVDIADPAHMSIAGQLALNDDAQAIHISSSYAYIAASSEGFIIYDISSPTSPSKIAQWKTSNSDAQDVYIQGGKAYLADGDNYTKVFNVSDPSDPVLEREINVGKNNTTIWAKISTTGKFIYIGDWDNLFTVVEWE